MLSLFVTYSAIGLVSLTGESKKNKSLHGIIFTAGKTGRKSRQIRPTGILKTLRYLFRRLGVTWPRLDDPLGIHHIELLKRPNKS